jgi:hypothetical protein
MSRLFSSAGTDYITFSPGSAPPDQGPITIGVLAKATDTTGWTGWMITAKKSTTKVWSLLTSNNTGAKLFMENDFGAGVPGLSTAWRWYVVTKATGSVLPRFHIWDLSGTWTHTNGSANVADGTGAITSVILGTDGGSSWRGKIAAAGAKATAMSDATVESTFTLSAANLVGLDWAVLLNQSSTATSVSDITGHSGNQSGISGTTVDADEPTGFNYSTSSGPTVTIWNGTAEVPVKSVTVWDGSAEVAANVSSIV